jgi:hypothetical protein
VLGIVPSDGHDEEFVGEVEEEEDVDDDLDDEDPTLFVDVEVAQGHEHQGG